MSLKEARGNSPEFISIILVRVYIGCDHPVSSNQHFITLDHFLPSWIYFIKYINFINILKYIIFS